jgi:hypothetical protein
MDQEVLFKNYIDICNQALEENKDKFPFDCILHGVQNASKSKAIRVKIVNDMGRPEFHLKLNNGEVQYDLMNCQKRCSSCHDACTTTNDAWSVRTSYLQDVINHPQQYIENPARLDWEWLGIEY